MKSVGCFNYLGEAFASLVIGDRLLIDFGVTAVWEIDERYTGLFAYAEFTGVIVDLVGSAYGLLEGCNLEAVIVLLT